MSPCPRCGYIFITRNLPSQRRRKDIKIAKKILKEYQRELVNLDFDSTGRKLMWHAIERLLEDLK